MNFCIETALKFETDHDAGERLIDYDEVYEDVIEPVGESARIWNQSFYPPKFAYRAVEKPRACIRTLKKGDRIVGVARDTIERQCEWFITSHDLLSDRKGLAGFGYVRKDEVKVTPRKKH